MILKKKKICIYHGWIVEISVKVTVWFFTFPGTTIMSFKVSNGGGGCDLGVIFGKDTNT